jgi:thiamine-phosphate pyrophosphorylase
LLCYITDRRQFPGNDSAQRQRLIEKIAEAARAGIDYVQLREKDLSARELEDLARSAVRILRSEIPGNTDPPARTRLLINSRTDVALTSGADGVHLRADDIFPSEVHRVWMRADANRTRPIVAISCHSLTDVEKAESQGADFALFGPVFEKPGAQPAGLEDLRQACRRQIPVLALGGVNLANAAACLEAGAAGIAAIRLFQENNIAEVVRELDQH